MAAITEAQGIQQINTALPQEINQENIPVLPNTNEVLFKEIPTDNTDSFYESTKAVALESGEFNAIREDQELSFSQLIDKHGLEKTLSVLSVDVLRQKFEAQFGEMPEADVLANLDMDKLATLNKAGILSDEMMGKIQAAREALINPPVEASAPVEAVAASEVAAAEPALA